MDLQDQLKIFFRSRTGSRRSKEEAPHDLRSKTYDLQIRKKEKEKSQL
jgi:hypothetical protein